MPSQLSEREYVALSDWPVFDEVFLTLDLECDYGTAIDSDRFYAAARTETLIDILERYSVPLTCFLQTEVLDRAPSGVRRLRDANIDVEFHPHSHTHPPRSQADVVTEVTESTRRVRAEFDTEPMGYRFPDGAARAADYAVLEDVGLSFDASLFPSWRPGRFNNTDAPMYPFSHKPSGIIELPFTVYSSLLRAPVSLSYLKLLGQPFTWLVRNRPPKTIVFDMHMHDLITPPAFDDLPPHYRAIYARQKHSGPAVLSTVIRDLKRQGFSFDTMSSLYEATASRFGGAHGD